ncbi:MAG: stage II sporulation protein P [Lachnospiraceae bacterium]|nr:stage II sporulation protein P [Lachnospiraceae bacterium]
MSSVLAWVFQGIALALLQLRWPAAVPAREKPFREPDPAYAVYQRYRYAYDTYGYLFLAEETGEGIGEGGAAAEAGGTGAGAGGAGTQVGGATTEGSGAGAQAGGAAAGAEAGGAAAEAGGAGAQVGGTAAQAGPGVALSEALSSISMEQLQDYDFLMRHFYSVHASTTADREVVRADLLLGTSLRLEKDPSVPQILIYHTHSQETYADYGPDNRGANVVENGRYLTELLQARGWNVIHDTSTYDIQGGKLDRNRAYTYALEGITGILQEHPTIQVVLDLHRDGVREGLRLVTEVEGKPTANIMFFQGMSRTPDGVIEYLPNPYLKENLAFSFQMQLAAQHEYPGLMRKIYLKGLRYNLHLRPRSALIEVGAQTNTGEEARNAMEPLAKLLDMVLQGN